MKIKGSQVDEFSREILDRFIPEMHNFLRTETPKMVSSMNEDELHQFCVASTEFGMKHGLEKQAHLVQLALCFLRMKVDFITRLPAAWVASPREDGSMTEDADWIEYVKNGSATDLS